MEIKKVRAHIFISGKVQGVFFRDSAKKKAKEIGVFGWVRNLADGRVEVLLEGNREKVEEMVLWLKTGPATARVDDLERTQEEYKGEFGDLNIL